MKNSSNKRLLRKLEHIELIKNLPVECDKTGFTDINLVHNAISSLALDEIDIGCSFLNKKLGSPFMINAITGGPDMATEINISLAKAAQQLNIPIAVGSQKIAVDNKEFRESFAVVRKECPSGVVLANLSALSSAKDALEAIEMLEADGIQLHLNLPQELAMLEGDRNFKGLIENIVDIANASPVPVIVKEVGFGISREIANSLWNKGINFIDIGGMGGTNFASIERQRRNLFQPSVFEEWGISTAVSIAEVASLSLPIYLIASGGIRNALDAIKAFALGADLVALARPCLEIILTESESALISYFNNLIYEFSALMLLVGTKSLDELNNIPIIITGKTKEWLEQRSSFHYYSNRTYIHY